VSTVREEVRADSELVQQLLDRDRIASRAQLEHQQLEPLNVVAGVDARLKIGANRTDPRLRYANRDPARFEQTTLLATLQVSKVAT